MHSHLLHVVPVGDDAVLDGVLQSQDTPLALGFVPHIAVLLTHTHHHTLRTKQRHLRIVETLKDAKTEPYKNLSETLGLFSYLVTGASNDGWEDSTGSVITGEPSLDQAGAVVAHEGGGLVVVTHVWSFLGWPSVRDKGWKQNISSEKRFILPGSGASITAGVRTPSCFH